MVVKRETLIKARNQTLKDQWIPLKAVVATRTNPARGRIAWVTDTQKNPWYRDAYLGGRSNHPRRYDCEVAQYEKGTLKVVAMRSVQTLAEAKEYLDRTPLLKN